MFAKKSTIQITRDHNKKLVKIIQSLLTAEQSVLFRKPVPFKSLGFDDYRQFIKKPIDLNLIRRQYNQSKYKTVQQVLDDLQLVWDNIIIYCKQDSEFYIQASKMEKIYHDLVKQLLAQFWQNINITEEHNRRNQEKKQILKTRQINLNNKSKKQIEIPIEVEIQQPFVPQRIQKIQEQKQQEKKKIIKSKSQIVVQQSELNSQIEQENSEEKQQQRQPILIKLNDRPSLEQLEQLNDWISQIQQKQDNLTLGKIFQVLYKFEKENLVNGSTNQNMDFKMNEIHISTYLRIRKLLQQKLDISPLKNEPSQGQNQNQTIHLNGNTNHKAACDLIE